MSHPTIRSFDDFWPHYLNAHRDPRSRALHYVGTSCAVGCVLGGLVTQNPLFFLAAPIVGYGPAWIGHFLLEGNKPATFGHPLWSLKGDFKMLGLALQGKLAAELARVSRERTDLATGREARDAAPESP